MILTRRISLAIATIVLLSTVLANPSSADDTGVEAADVFGAIVLEGSVDFDNFSPTALQQDIINAVDAGSPDYFDALDSAIRADDLVQIEALLEEGGVLSVKAVAEILGIDAGDSIGTGVDTGGAWVIGAVLIIAAAVWATITVTVFTAGAVTTVAVVADSSANSSAYQYTYVSDGLGGYGSTVGTDRVVVAAAGAY